MPWATHPSERTVQIRVRVTAFQNRENGLRAFQPDFAWQEDTAEVLKTDSRPVCALVVEEHEVEVVETLGPSETVRAGLGDAEMLASETLRSKDLS